MNRNIICFRNRSLFALATLCVSGSRQVWNQYQKNGKPTGLLPGQRECCQASMEPSDDTPHQHERACVGQIAKIYGSTPAKHTYTEHVSDMKVRVYGINACNRSM